MDKVEGHLEIGTNERREVVINLDRDRTGHIVFSPNQARGLAESLLRKAAEAEGHSIEANHPAASDLGPVVELTAGALEGMINQAMKRLRSRDPRPPVIKTSDVAQELLLLMQSASPAPPGANTTGASPAGASPTGASPAASPGAPDVPASPSAPCIRPLAAIRIVHDQISSALRAATGAFKDVDRGTPLRAYLQAFCWVLRCGDRQFELEMALLSAAIRSEGVRSFASRALTKVEGEALREAGLRYVLIREAPGCKPPGKSVSIQCLVCLHISNVPEDVENLFCPKCRQFHDELLDADLAELQAWAAGKK